MKRVFKVGSVAMASVLACFGASNAYAGSTTSSMAVSATVSASCAITSTTAMAFGAITASSLPANATGTVVFSCTTGTSWMVFGDTGQHASASQRRLSDGTNFMNYNVYSDSGRTAAFPTSLGTLGSGNTGGSGTGSSQTLTLYGQIPAGTVLPPPGSYSDSVTLTLNW